MNYNLNSSKWIIFPQPVPEAKLRLFCFPYAGRGAGIFRNWQRELPDTIEICAVQLPGREERLREPLFSRFSPLINTLSQVLLPHLERPFAFFGHSLGALICFELARELRRQKASLPQKLIVSGRRAPQIPDSDSPESQLPEPEFIERLRLYNGTPAEVLQNPELLAIYLPILRADLAVIETYTYVTEKPLNCSLFCYGGINDPETTRNELVSWKEHTQKDFRIRMFPGNHFFLNQERKLVLQYIAKDLMG